LVDALDQPAESLKAALQSDTAPNAVPPELSAQ
jgi:hypothetical protein